MYNVAQFYEYGKGVQQDYEQAEYWYNQLQIMEIPMRLRLFRSSMRNILSKSELPELQNDSAKENKNDVVAVSAASQNSSPNDAQEIIEDSLTLEKTFFQDNNELSAHADHETQTTRYISQPDSQPDISQPDRSNLQKLLLKIMN